ncbi:hypothetical protein FANTH_13875 [Fusarium anthophilum]|uniref:Trichothecene 3-O-acetyltransferase-like N-terminal domain-containing protein n=1 Tax=Fusarium anthophilum TaxID=48485 RepID=A0A8H5DNU1_9HYPO|nr:hypothetical protein FANTH_13875 [Fusarium anthophilum]
MDDLLDIFGQQPFFTINTQICFIFGTSEASSYDSIIDTLTSGLERLYGGFPWLAYDVTNEGSGPANTGIYKFTKPSKVPGIIVKDLRDVVGSPTMENLRQARYPMGILDESIFAPCKTFASGKKPKSAPVFLIQANLISGGLILTFVAQHNTMDMTGQAHIISLFSKACRGEPFTDEELSSGNAVRHNIIPLLDESWTPGPELEPFILNPADFPTTNTNTNTEAHPPPTCTWAYVNFTASSLQQLKWKSLESVRPPNYVSTDDALTAFLWKSVTRARSPRLDILSPSTIARAVNVRKQVGIPPTYPGSIHVSAYTTLTVQQLIEKPLGYVALKLRSAIDPETSDLEFHARAIATFLSRTPDKTRFSATANFDTSIDMILSSWSNVNVHWLDFNLGLGNPEAVRRPRFYPVEGLNFLMPKTADGDVAVALCLRDEDLERLKKDKQFSRYGEYIG